MRHEVATPINAPADVVWQTMSDVNTWPEWTPTMTEIRRLDDGELRVGSTAEVQQPRQSKRTWTVTDLIPGKAFTWTSGGPGLRMSADHVVSPGEDGKVVATLSFSLSGPLAPVVSLVAGKAIRKAVDTEASSLKARCESRSRQQHG